VTTACVKRIGVERPTCRVTHDPHDLRCTEQLRKRLRDPWCGSATLDERSDRFTKPPALPETMR